MALPAWNMPTKGVSLNYNPMKMQIGSPNNATNLAAAAIPQPAAASTGATTSGAYTGPITNWEQLFQAAQGAEMSRGTSTQALQQQLADLFSGGYGGMSTSWFGDPAAQSTSLSDWYKR